MKKFVRYVALITVTALVTGLIVFTVGGAPNTADAQPAPGSAATAPADGAGAPATAPAPGGAPAPAAAAPADPWYVQLEKLPIDEDGNFWLPKAVNEEADSTDQMFIAVLGMSIFFFFGITAAVVYLVIKYRHRPGHKAQPSASHNDVLEITWTIIPTIISVFLFYYGWRTYIQVVTPPTQAVEINVVASKWTWKFTHSNGAEDTNLHVPANTPVRLVMTSTDVLHAFYAPAMRVKQDLIPKRYTYAWFVATKPGVYRLTCAEYCGTDHSQMACKVRDQKTGACLQRAVVVVHADQPGFDNHGIIDKGYLQYLSDNKPPADPVELGQKVYNQQCVSCHTIDGTPRIGPSFFKNWGTPRKFTDGSEAVMDETYIRESLENPQAKIRAGFPNSMTPFAGKLKESEINGLVQFIKSLK